MIIGGLKVTHDGGVTLVVDGQLVFSAEMEKCGNAERHAHLDDLAVAWELVREHGYEPEDLDALMVRHRRGLTQRDVAERMGVTKGRVSQIEQDAISGRDVLSRYAVALAGRLHQSIYLDDGDIAPIA